MNILFLVDLQLDDEDHSELRKEIRELVATKSFDFIIGTTFISKDAAFYIPNVDIIRNIHYVYDTTGTKEYPIFSTDVMSQIEEARHGDSINMFMAGIDNVGVMLTNAALLEFRYGIHTFLLKQYSVHYGGCDVIRDGISSLEDFIDGARVIDDVISSREVIEFYT